jgi:DNA-nicking Smr family endonuclease
MKRRSLNSDDQELWNKVAKTAKPLHNAAKKRALPYIVKAEKIFDAACDRSGANHAV